MKFLKSLYIIVIFLLISCGNSSLLESGLEGINKDIKERFAKDKRVAIYDVKVNSVNTKILITGETIVMGSVSACCIQ